MIQCVAYSLCVIPYHSPPFSALLWFLEDELPMGSLACRPLLVCPVGGKIGEKIF